MASSGNFCIMNPLVRTTNSMAYTFGNLRTSPSSSWSTTTWARGSMVIPSDKKIYFEVLLQTQASNYSVTGIGTNLSVPSGTNVGGTGSVTIYNDGKYINGTYTSGIFSIQSAGTIMQVAVDGATRKVWLGYNNTWIGSGDPANGTNEAGTVTVSEAVGYDLMPVGQNNASGVTHYNFGQDSTFGGEKTAGGNADGNGFGDFFYSPPSGFLALCSGNLSISDDIDPAQTDTDFPQKQFNAITYTGTGSNGNNITGLGFQPDLVWFKNRSNGGGAYKNNLADTNRGVTNVLYSDSQNAEDTNGDITSFDSDGFSVGGSGTYVNASGQNYVAWCWRCNGGTTTSDSSGDITVNRQSNTSGGFAILTYTGNGSDNQTIAHGLGKTPALVITKNRSSTSHWAVWHHQHTGYYGQLEYYGAWASDSNQFYTAGMTSNFIGVRTAGATNSSGHNMLAYVWAEVEGYSKFGKYEGNANSDGTFVFTGGRPVFLWVKDVDRGEYYQAFDSARNTFNPVDKGLSSASNGAESTGSGSGFDVDFLSNGFKMRCTHDNLNGSSTYVYACYMDIPFKYGNTF